MKRGYFIYGGERSIDYGLYVSGGATYNAPERDYSIESIPGRNGDWIRDNGRFKNIKVSYKVFLTSELVPFSERARAARNFLLRFTGYQRLEDTWNPDVYRIGVFDSSLDFVMNQLCRVGEAELTFNCKPQRFLKSGEIKEIITAHSAHIFNPTPFIAYPDIRLYQSSGGSITIGSTMTVSAFTQDYMDISTDLQFARCGDELLNSKITPSHIGDYFHLKPGDNIITTHNGVSKLELKGNWWEV